MKTIFKAYRMENKDLAMFFASYEDAIGHARADVQSKHPEYKIEETYYGSISTARSWYVENKNDPAMQVWAIHEVPLF